MRIAVLEWISCGGMHAIAIDDIPKSLACEGRAMLECLIELFAATDFQVVTLSDPRFLDQGSIASTACDVEQFEIDPAHNKVSAVEQTIAAWLRLAKTCDVALIVAPEIDCILQRCVSSMRAQGINLLNCSGQFLENCASKLLTAQKLIAAGVAHPKTLCADQFLRSATDDSTWCVKSELGAGCDGLLVGSFWALKSWLTENRSNSDLSSSTGTVVVQPWIEGRAFSCSAVIDRSGTAHWMPLVTQRFETVSVSDSLTSKVYLGGEVLADDSDMQPPLELLNLTLQILSANSTQEEGPLGWIGVDLLLEDSGNWMIIEVNPRLTTSVMGLAKSASTNLADLMLQAWSRKASSSPLPIHWRSSQFRAPLGT